MIQATDNRLVISIRDTSPAERRQYIIKALAASMRWAAYADKTDCDPENIIVLAQLLEEMTDTQN